MSLVSLILALALEQLRPFDRRLVSTPLAAYADFLERHFNAGELQHGAIAWCLAVVPLAAAGWGLYAAAVWLNPLLGVVVNVAVLYATMGFRQSSHFFTGMQRALREGDVDRARAILSQWRGGAYPSLSPSEVARLAIEDALVVSHRNVFGVIFWFMILPGPAGAIAYRAAERVAEHWNVTRTDLGEFGAFARRAFELMDWLPVRLTALSFAIVGDFEDAVYCWRTQAARWADALAGIVIASGAGALGVRLGMPVARDGVVEDRPEMGTGDDADTAFLDSTVGLVWRALVLWLLLIGLIALARAVG
ncbi:MAG: CobD/CbiB family protein [Burkholderiales bacterium]|nr:CobD/CbiB family protein [Burkholderiales bacterium]